ncbi:MAG: ATP dependent DNA ligase, partial [Polyangiales bacterium]
PRSSFMLNPVRPMVEGSVDSEFDAARARGNEGLMLKRVDAAYEAGRRGQAWIKVKKAFATLDVVITAAQEGTGKRAGTLSDYTFGVWRQNELVNVGKAYSGVTDDEIDRLTQRLVKATVERFGGTRVVRPEIVLEVGFDGIQRSTRHKSGYALRFPRIVRIRDDKTPEQADMLETVEKLFQSQLDTGHREVETAKERETRVGKQKPKKKKSKNQLSLFDEDD